MERDDILKIAEGLRLIEQGVSTIQQVMKEKNVKSISDIAENLMPLFEQHDDVLKTEIINHLK